MKRLFYAMIIMAAIVLSVCVTATAAEVDNNMEITNVANGATVGFDSDGAEKINVSYGTNLDGYYLVMMLTANENGNYIPTKDSIQYIDQTTAANGKVEFTVYPKEMTAGKIMLYGKNVSGESNQLELATLEVSGVTISGTVTSYLVADGEVTIRVLSGETEIAKTVTTSGTYILEGIPAGTYILEVNKADHVTREYEITIEDQAITMDVKVCPIGDVTQDGRVNIRDNSRLYAHVQGSNALTGYALKCGDTTRDGRVNIRDMSRLYAHVQGTNLLF